MRVCNEHLKGHLGQKSGCPPPQFIPPPQMTPPSTASKLRPLLSPGTACTLPKLPWSLLTGLPALLPLQPMLRPQEEGPPGSRPCHATPRQPPWPLSFRPSGLRTHCPSPPMIFPDLVFPRNSFLETSQSRPAHSRHGWRQLSGQPLPWATVGFLTCSSSVSHDRK